NAAGLAARHVDLLRAQKRHLVQPHFPGGQRRKLRVEIAADGENDAGDVFGIDLVFRQQRLHQLLGGGADGFQGVCDGRSRSPQPPDCRLCHHHPVPSFIRLQMLLIGKETARWARPTATSSKCSSPMPKNMATAMWSSLRAMPILPPTFKPTAFSPICRRASWAAPATAPSSGWVAPMTPSRLAATTARSMTRRT